MTLKILSTWPLSTWPVTSTFAEHQARKPPSVSPGVDLAVPLNTPLPSPCAGKVFAWKWSATGGRMLIIDSGMGLWHLMHLSVGLVAVGEKVKAGQAVALSGSTGHSTGPHVHVSLRIDGRWVDPWPVLKGST